MCLKERIKTSCLSLIVLGVLSGCVKPVEEIEPTPTPTPKIIFSAATLEDEVVQEASKYGSIKEVEIIFEDNQFGGSVIFEDNSQKTFLYDQDFNLLNVLDEVNYEPYLTSTTMFDEMLIRVGNAPSLYGILTTPKNSTTSPVVILLSEEVDDGIDESGNDSTFRRDLAHYLAEFGVASIRYENRAYHSPYLLGKTDEYDFGKLVSYDFASVAHMVEHLPVDPTDISVFGIGDSSSYALGLTYDHFEVTGGVALVNYTKPGHLYLADKLGLDGEELETYLEDENDTTSLRGYSKDYWLNLKHLDVIDKYDYIKAPKFFISTEDSDEWDETYELFKRKLRTNLKYYKDVDEHFRDEDGELDEKLVGELAYWIKLGSLPKKGRN